MAYIVLLHGSANHACMTVQQISDQIVVETDTSGDGIVQLSELLVEVTNWGLDSE